MKIAARLTMLCFVLLVLTEIGSANDKERNIKALIERPAMSDSKELATTNGVDKLESETRLSVEQSGTHATSVTNTYGYMVPDPLPNTYDLSENMITGFQGTFSSTVFYDTNRLFRLLAQPGFVAYRDAEGDSVLTFLLSNLEGQCKKVVAMEDLIDHGEKWRRYRILLLEMLIKAGCDVNHQGRLEKTPLYWAVEYGSMEECKMLVAAGAKLDKETARNWGRWASKDIAKWMEELSQP